DHIDVEVGYDLRERYHGMLGEVSAAPEALLLTAHGEEDDRPLRSGARLAERLSQLDDADSSRAVIIGPVHDAVGLAGPDSDLIHVRRVDGTSRFVGPLG